jgi:hypothetical protein
MIIKKLQKKNAIPKRNASITQTLAAGELQRDQLR